MAGCECPTYQNAIYLELIAWNWNSAEWEVETDYFLLAAIYYCPWCGAKLTPPEEARDEAE